MLLNKNTFRALAIEDDSDCAELLIAMLEECPLGKSCITHTSSVESARQMLCEAQYDLILLGLGLKDSLGADTVKSISPLSNGSAIVVVSAETDRGLMLEVIKLGVQDFISKLNAIDQNSFYLTIEFALARAEQRKHFVRLAHHDHLTGLPNRSLFEDHLESAHARALRQGTTFSLIFVDLDEFKPINDLYGHDTGDSVLREFGQRLLQLFRRRDTVARIGGDEFCVIVEEVEQQGLKLIQEKIASALCAPMPGLPEAYTVTASVGTATYPIDAEDLVSLFRAADANMYLQKSAGSTRRYRNGSPLIQATLLA